MGSMLRQQVSPSQHPILFLQVLVCLLSIVDDTELVSKIIIRELEQTLKELLLDQNARRLFLQLLHPDCARYFSPVDLTSLSLSIPCLKNKGGSDVGEAIEENKESDGDQSDGNVQLNEGGKKDSFKWRQ